MSSIDLRGRWDFCLDGEKVGIKNKYFINKLKDSIVLPTTVAEAKKGKPSDAVHTGFLTDPYQFEGYTWYSREIDCTGFEEHEVFLVLERTRTSHIWIEDMYVGSENSICTSHRYRLTPYLHKNLHKLTIMVDNSSCPVKGGHMTSQDTQTNWNGITGNIFLEILPKVYITKVKIYPDAACKQLKVKATLIGAKEAVAGISVTASDHSSYAQLEQGLIEGENTLLICLDQGIETWSEHTPILYSLNITLAGHTYHYSFGLRDFKAVGSYFEINGKRTFLRGKHDGLLFPLTGYAPTDLESWLKIMTKAKSYGINHYRFHTCCPPEAAFTAADLLGIYMEPELPFWGTVTREGDEGHDEKGQQYLIKEGYGILDEFGNHPSFVMMSLGNELWGSKERLNEILRDYKRYDGRPLFTQGSNNFQFVPCILKEEDFFCGVRFSRDRLIRGSYAMCDAPQGHIQTMAPNSLHNYNEMIRPRSTGAGSGPEGEILIQYETGVKRVHAEAEDELIPKIPVVSHEIGQYAMYPDFREIERYTGVLKPRNLIEFQRRLEEKGMLDYADGFFRASGRFAAECYKAEIETALRSSELAGFQLLDLQDFSGQGTALVGVLNAFMESKGVITEEEWREFCSDTVLLGELPRFVYRAGERVAMGLILATFAKIPISFPKIRITILTNDRRIEAKESMNVFYSTELSFLKEYSCGVYHLGQIELELPKVKRPQKLKLQLDIQGSSIKNHYDLWLYPSEDVDYQASTPHQDQILITEDVTKAIEELKKGNKVLLFPNHLNDENSLEGTYCTDFWCYPMFRSISESMNKPLPIGTHGLWIDEKHPIFEAFPTDYYSTPQWYDIVSTSRALIIDGTSIHPIVCTIDNFERNHRLALIFEATVARGKLIICTSNLVNLKESLPAAWLLRSILQYMKSDHFKPDNELEVEELSRIFIIR